MIARDLAQGIWNSIADLVSRSQTPREIYFVKVKKADAKRNLVWAEDFGDLAIPLVSHTYGFAYFDTVPTGNAVSGSPIATQKQKRSDPTNTNDLFRTKIICPKVGDLVIVLDVWGAKRFPICIGTIQSKGFWEEG